jgi:hypothetical protein
MRPAFKYSAPHPSIEPELRRFGQTACQHCFHGGGGGLDFQALRTGEGPVAFLGLYQPLETQRSTLVDSCACRSKGARENERAHNAV